LPTTASSEQSRVVCVLAMAPSSARAGRRDVGPGADLA
jgi:hypothetical protein